MSGLLANAVDAFLRNLKNERSFDVPLVALLRLHGFFDIHCIHGPFEFGKDFIAKRLEEGVLTQYCFQSKLGDIDTKTWDQDVQPQLEKSAYTKIAHPSFDQSAPKRKNVLVFTGDFKAQSRVLSQEYMESVSARDLPPVAYWGKERLQSMFLDPSCLLEPASLRSITGFCEQVLEGLCDVDDVERLSLRWVKQSGSDPIWRVFLEAAFAQQQFTQLGLFLYEARTAQTLARSIALWLLSDGLTDDLRFAAELLKQEFTRQASSVLDAFASMNEEQRQIATLGPHPMAMVTCGAMLLRIGEILSIAMAANPGFVLEREGDLKELLHFTLSQGATAKPLGDRHAYSVMLSALAGMKLGVDVSPFLSRTVAWVCDNYEGDNLGLAPVRVDLKEDLYRTIGAMLDKPEYERRRESLLASAILDTTSILRLTRLYEDAHNDFLAVGIIPNRIIPKTPPDEFFIGRSGCATAFLGDYSACWTGEDGWKNAKSHTIAYSPRTFDDLGLPFLGVALGAVLRDRWWLFSLVSSYGVREEAGPG